MSIARIGIVTATAFLLATAARVDAQVPKNRPPGPRPRSAPAGSKLVADVEYAKVGNRSLRLDLYLPEKSEGPVPVIVAIHGGAWLAGSKEGAVGIREAARGYAVASVGYRLSREAIFPAQIEDCKAAVRWLRAHAKEYGLDPTRIGVIGHSAGGHLASMLGTTAKASEFEKGEHLDQSSAVDAVCAMSGPSDLTAMAAHAIPGATIDHDAADSPESRLIGGPVQENKEKAAKANPITYVTKAAPPFLLIHGDADPLVPSNQSERLRDALERAGAKVRLEIIPGAGHGLGGPRIDKMIDTFFDEHLKSRKTDAPQAPASARPS
ncbi:MAG: alpha/beta hydrolase [Isosphaeraceae bacterium]|nr:alpha/beta hydrolase [Isosphaeraceae bacterium]